jgi:LPS export ABC transporter protein LptC
LAKSGRSNIENKDLLDLVNVRGEISSSRRDTIYIVSDYGQFNSVNSSSKFYDNVVINYQEKQITCKNFDINMETNKAIAYNNVIITDPISEMKAGKVEFDLKTKNININPQSANAEIKVITN